MTMEFHCNNILISMAAKADGDSEQFSITLPVDAIEMIEQGLIPFGLYGKRRATVCTSLILDALKQSSVQDQIRQGRAKRRDG